MGNERPISVTKHRVKLYLIGNYYCVTNFNSTLEALASGWARQVFKKMLPCQVAWLRSDPPPPSPFLLNIHLRFCCPRSPCLLYFLYYRERSKTWSIMINTIDSFKNKNCIFLLILFVSPYDHSIQRKSQNR